MAIAMTLFRRLAALCVPIVLGGTIVVLAANGKAPLEREANKDRAHPVRVITVPKTKLVPRVHGFGVVQAERKWDAVAEITGQVIELKYNLKEGEFILKGSVLARIDSNAYKLVLAELTAKLAQKQIEDDNVRVSIKIEMRNAELAARDLERKRNLEKRGTSTQAAVDTAERTLLAIRQSAQNLQNKLALIPTERAVIEAQIAKAKLDIEHSTIRAPFDMRVINVKIEKAQFVSAGQVLFSGDSIDRAEIIVQVSLNRAATLFPADLKFQIDPLKSSEQLLEIAGFKPIVYLNAGIQTYQWPAKFVRMHGTIDAKTRTVGIVIAVDNPYGRIDKSGTQLPKRLQPPLVDGMFVEVEILGHAQEGRIIIPRTAIHGDDVYLVDADKRLHRQSVETAFSVGKVTVIRKGLRGGETLIVSDVIPAIEGMLLTPLNDDKAEKVLKANAAGETIIGMETTVKSKAQ